MVLLSELLDKKQKKKKHFFQLNTGWHTTSGKKHFLGNLAVMFVCLMHSIYFTLTNGRIMHAHKESNFSGENISCPTQTGPLSHIDFQLVWTNSRKSYCTTPGVGIGVGVGVGVWRLAAVSALAKSLMLKFFM